MFPPLCIFQVHLSKLWLSFLSHNFTISILIRNVVFITNIFLFYIYFLSHSHISYFIYGFSNLRTFTSSYVGSYARWFMIGPSPSLFYHPNGFSSHLNSLCCTRDSTLLQIDIVMEFCRRALKKPF